MTFVVVDDCHRREVYKHVHESKVVNLVTTLQIVDVGLSSLDLVVVQPWRLVKVTDSIYYIIRIDLG